MDQYEKDFYNIVKKREAIGLDENSALYKKLRSSARNVLNKMKESNNYVLLSMIYDLRIQEKDFINRDEIKYANNFIKKFNTFLSYEDSFPSGVKEDLIEYKNNFQKLVAAEKEYGLTKNLGLRGQMRDTVHKTETILSTMMKNISVIINKEADSEKNTIIIISIILIIFVLLFSYFISKNISNKIENFKNDLLNFFKYLNRESSDVKHLDDSVKDEIGIMAAVVNENIIKTKQSIEEDRKLIDETIAVLGEFEQGDLCQRLNLEVSNPALMELKDVLNKMASNLENNIDNVLNILEEYSNYKYLNKIDQKGLKEHLLKLANGVNNLGDSITEMLIENENTGLVLENSSETLIKNVDVLNTNSNEAAAALEETAAAIEEITGNMANNTQNVVKMADYAKELSKSANSGQELATKTTSSMDEINEEVESINEAIGVIDQIAFQTNILSLNAAVEAATAGEAGKGFAVVAQEVRNLASKSAEAAKKIKEIVEKATLKANDGKQIASEMILGYENLNKNIKSTLDLISDVEMASKEQSMGIEQINDAITSLDQQTQQNAAIATQTHEISIKTEEITRVIMEKVNEKEFIRDDEKKDKNIEKTDEEKKEIA